MKIKLISRFGAVLAVLAVLGLSFFPGRAVSYKENKRAEARHFYLKGTVSEAEENIDEAYEYYKKAYNADPEYLEGAFSYASMKIVLPADTVNPYDDKEKTLATMRHYVDAYPHDVTASEIYAMRADRAEMLPEALRIYRRLVKEHPGLSRLYPQQSYYFSKAQMPDSAVWAVEQYERLEGESPEFLVKKISYYLAASDTVKALRLVDDYLASHPGDVDALINAGSVYYGLEMPDSARAMMQRAYVDFPDKGEIRYNMAILAAQDGDTAAFHQMMTEAFRSKDLDLDDKLYVLDNYVQLMQKEGMLGPEGDKLIKEAIETYPDDAGFYRIADKNESFKGNDEKALAYAEKALKLEPDNIDYLERVMNLNNVLKRPKASIEAYDNFPDEKAKKRYSPLFSYIQSNYFLGNYDKALENIDTLIQNTISSLSLSDTITDEWIEKEDLVGKNYSYLDLFVVSAAYEVAGDNYAKKGNNEDAARSYENSITILFESNPSALNNYAYFLIEKMNSKPGSPEFEKAKEMSRKSLEDTENNPQGTYYDTYAWILFKEQDYKKALEYQEVAIDLTEDDDAAELHSHYGDILFMNGRPQEALEQWRKALELEPDDTLLQKKVKYETFFYE